MFQPPTRPSYVALLLQSVAIVALIGATVFLVAPSAVATDAGVTPSSPHHAASTGAKGESIDERIDSLHKSLKITADEEANWSLVAQSMRDNDAALRKLVAARQAEAPSTVSAVDDLKTYEKITQAHVDGLKSLIAAFETLYNSMPEPQQRLADQVFQSFGHSAKPMMH